MVIQQGERVAAATGKRKVAFKIHLPELVGRAVFEASGGRNAGCASRQQTVAGHQVVHGAERGQNVSAVLKPALNLTGAPAFMGAVGHAQQVRHTVIGSPGRMERRTGTVGKTGGTFLSPAAKPLVAGGRRNVEMTAECPEVRPVLRGEQYKLRT
ncbi:hypothetical protein PUATCC27989T_00743 [Phytobacter ursingii]|nr:hypothetical protein PUATCC27989T_00743 [Phytobacter ursingii]